MTSNCQSRALWERLAEVSARVAELEGRLAGKPSTVLEVLHPHLRQVAPE